MASPQPAAHSHSFSLSASLSLAVEEVLKEKSVVEGALKDCVVIRTLLPDDNPAVIISDALNIRHRVDEADAASLNAARAHSNNKTQRQRTRLQKIFFSSLRPPFIQ